jgi:hypothetical protein
MHRDPFIASAYLQPSLSPTEWGSWSHEAMEQADDGPGLLVSRMFWAGGAMSLLLWACASYLVLAFT